MKIAMIQNFIFARPTLPLKPFAQCSYALATSRLKPARTVVASTASTHILMYDAKTAANTDLTKIRKVCTWSSVSRCTTVNPRHRRSTLLSRLYSRSFSSGRGRSRSSSKGTSSFARVQSQLGMARRGPSSFLKKLDYVCVFTTRPCVFMGSFLSARSLVTSRFG